MSHSLAEAVADGTITAQTAFCGLVEEDVERLAAHPRHSDALILVRLRTAFADGRITLTPTQLVAWCAVGGELAADGRSWTPDDIRDVFPWRP